MTEEREKELRRKNDSYPGLPWFAGNECLDAIAEQREEMAGLRESNRHYVVRAKLIAETSPKAALVNLAEALKPSAMLEEADLVIAELKAEIARLRAVVEALKAFNQGDETDDDWTGIMDALAALDAGEARDEA
jgi:hypothetical protein